MRNKYEIHKGVERADFILKYTSQQIPTGMFHQSSFAQNNQSALNAYTNNPKTYN